MSIFPNQQFFKEGKLAAEDYSKIPAYFKNAEDRPPYTLFPAKENIALNDVIEALKVDRDAFQNCLLKKGAILFRDFPVTKAEEYQAFVEALEPALSAYVGGVAPRHVIKGKVMNSTYYPPHLYLDLHNESTYKKEFPKRIYLHCHKPATKGGETPIADSRVMYNSIDPDIRKKFEEKNLVFQRFLPEKADERFKANRVKTWPETFGSKEDLKAYCKKYGATATFNEEGKLLFSEKRPAVFETPNGEKSWANHMHNFHKSFFYSKGTFEKGLKDEDYPFGCTYGDGEPIPDEVVNHIREKWNEIECAFKWKAGDVLMVENLTFAHGRNPYEGERKIQLILVN